MDVSNEFNLTTALNDWVKRNCSAEDMTPADTRDMKEHMLSTVQELVEENKLSEEEAFAVAKIRFGGKDDWADEMQTVNEKNFQLKKIIILLGGIFIFIFANYFIQCIDKCLFIALYYLYGNNEINIGIIKVLNQTIFAITVILFIAVYFRDISFEKWLKRINIRPLFILLFIVSIFGLAIFDWYLVTKVNSVISDRILSNSIFIIERKFKNYYLLMSGIGYIILFFRYYRKFEK